MELKVKFFDSLTTRELYEILKIRTAVFVVEQECPYPEVDGTDYDALHVWLEEDGEIKAYLRAFPKGENTVQIGRVLSAQRGIGLGGKIIRAGIEAVKEKLPCQRIYIEAQTYALAFYEKVGFVTAGEEFLEDGIPHTPMTLEM